jgi:hypothetical protein
MPNKKYFDDGLTKILKKYYAVHQVTKIKEN